jgi:polysaccharide biosynthesis transport protein
MTMQKTVLAHDIDMLANGSAQGAGSQITLVDLVRVLRVRRRIIIGATVLMTALAVMVVMQLTPIYTATAVVMLDQRKNSVTTEDALTGLPSDQSTIQNQVQILTSLELVNRVADKLHLDTDPSFTETPAGLGSVLHYLNPLSWFPGRDNIEAVAHGISPKRSAILHKLLGGLSVNPVGLSTAINISYQSRDRYSAAKVANAFADAYVEDQLEAKFQATQKATQWLSGRISEMSRQAQAADAAVQRYKADNHLTTPVNGVSVVDQQIRDINSQLVIAKANLAEKQANYDSIVSLQRTGQAANSEQVIGSPLIAALRGQETDLNRQIANLSSRYLPSHPKILDLQAQQQNLQGKINEEVQRIVESVHNDLIASNAHVASLQGSLSQLEGQGAGQDRSSVQLTALQSASTSARSMYEAFLGRLSQTQDREAIQAPDARVISAAEVPGSPSFPNKGLAIGLSIPAGLLLGLMLAFLAERFDTGFRTSGQLEALLGVPVIAIVPEAGRRNAKEHVADLVTSKPTSAFAEAIRGLKLGVQLSNVDRPPKVVLVTSSVPSEGKTTVAISLARAAAAGGLKTVLVDCDMRRPTAMKRAHQDDQKGLVEVLAEPEILDHCLTKDTLSNALLLPCMSVPPSPSDLLTSHAMQQLVVRLRAAFDLVILDSAPVLPVNDAKILGRLVDTVLFVVRWEKTPREAAFNAIRALNDVHVPIAGVAMTRADNERFRYYSYGYQDYQSYSKYYSE